ncbi:MAG: hypothetical protein ACI94Y_001140 [Maribacter sp.]|jgi:hypothetical protein
MLKKIDYFFLTIILLLFITGIVGVRWFNNMWFKERPNHFTFVYDLNLIDFEWAEGTYGGHFKPHAARLIPVRIEGMPNKFYLQFDTGSPLL